MYLSLTLADGLGDLGGYWAVLVFPRAYVVLDYRFGGSWNFPRCHDVLSSGLVCSIRCNYYYTSMIYFFNYSIT